MRGGVKPTRPAPARRGGPAGEFSAVAADGTWYLSTTQTNCYNSLMRYTAIFEAQPDGGYHAFCPALVGCHSEGDTLDESIANLREAVTVYLESLQAHGEPLPIEDILIQPLEVAIPA
jgi:predicted RNase H-like HicB family nuclease